MTFRRGSGRGRVRPIVVNGAFRPQRTTGQQRYAGEIANRLVVAGVREIRPSKFWGRSSIRTWVWTLLVLPVRTRRNTLVSLTSRAPIWHPRHVVAIHDLFVLTNPEWYSRKYIWSHVPILRLQLRWSASVVAVSQPVVDELQAHPRTGPITLAPNAPSEMFANASATFAEVGGRFGLQRDAFILAIGSQDPRKNLDRLAQAWALVPDALRVSRPLVIVGGGDAIFSQEAIAWPTGTVVTGYVSDAELVSLYEAARAVALVSLAEGFGLPIIEAAAAGVTRFVLSDIEVFHWIAGEAAVFVDPTSITEIAAALQSTVDGGAAPTSRIDVGRFKWDRSAAAVLEAAQRVT